jgi:hypothetical protein
MVTCTCDDYKNFKCMDCRCCTLCISEYYMVTDAVWDPVAKSGMLCIGCLEARRGRLLTSNDFSPVPLNRMNFGMGSERLVNRLTN